MISIRDFSKEEILHVLETAKEFEQNKVQNFLEGKVIASLFFEPSTRTRLSFETAINRLGAKVIGFSDATNTSQSKGETLKDTIKMVSNYVDMIVMRHPLEGSSRYASEVASVPVVNAGDGANQHPSQTLLDLYSILQTQGTLEGLTINMVGDLKYGRTTHSLLQAMSHFNPKFIFTAPDELKMPKEYKDFLDSRGIEYIETTSLNEHLNDWSLLFVNPDLMPEFAALFATKRPSSALLRGAACDPEVLALIENLSMMQGRDDPISTARRKGYLLTLFALLFEKMQLLDNTSDDLHTLKSLVSFCTQNYTKDLSLSLLEQELHISKYYISHLFSDKLGIGFNDYINSLRVALACRLLRDTDRSVTEVSREVGFGTLRTFNRAFQKQLGITPGDYRRTAAEKRKENG